jgi:hypothetical protein
VGERLDATGTDPPDARLATGVAEAHEGQKTARPPEMS